MPRPCCKHVYKKYLDDEGHVIEKELKKIYIFPFNLIERGSADSLLKETYVKTLFFEQKLCMCACHTIGVNIIH
jgi:hypothetical protein